MPRFSLIPKEEQYFALFRQMTSYIYDAARALVEMLEDSGADYAKHVAGIKSIEHACDELTHSISTKLNSSFITPFDREDIYELASALDDVVDYLEEASDLLALYRVTTVRERALEQCRILVDACDGLAKALANLATLSGVQRHINAVRDLEDEGDAAVRAAIAGLFEDDVETRDLIRWKDIHEALEQALDSADRAANVVGNIVLKNA